MNRERETIEKYSVLSKMRLSSKEQEDIWNNISKELRTVIPLKRHRRSKREIGTSVAAVAAVVIVASGLYAFNERQKTLPNAVNSTGQKSQSVQFPRLIRQSMKQFPPDVLTFAKAPALLPLPKTVSNGLAYRTWDTTTGPIMSYNVLFSSGGNQIAMFGGSRYQSSTLANNAARLPENLASGNHLSNSTVRLHNGILAQGKTFDASNQSAKQNSFGELRWTSKQWKIEVTDNQKPHLPIEEANSVVHELQSATLPVPASNGGTIFVDVEAGRQVSMYIKWQDGSQVYEVDTYSGCDNPVQTGLKMAASMTKYPAG